MALQVNEARPYPKTLWSADAHTGTGIDCSSFCILCYKEAGCSDPNNTNYDGNGNTWSLRDSSAGTTVIVPAPADIILYDTPGGACAHAALYIGNGKCIEIGGSAGIHETQLGEYPSYIIRSFLPL